MTITHYLDGSRAKIKNRRITVFDVDGGFGVEFKVLLADDQKNTPHVVEEDIKNIRTLQLRLTDESAKALLAALLYRLKSKHP